MQRAIVGTILMNCAGWLTFGQSLEPQPKFEAADVHISAKTAFPHVRTGPVRGGRYEVKTATMVDLIKIAYDFDTDKVLGGPNWLEMDRFDVIAKVPADSTQETQKAMLQALLAERFKLVVHKDTKPLPTHALTAGKKLQIKEASGSEETGCKPQTASGPPGEGGIRMMTMNSSGVATTLNLGPGMTIQFQCRNITMEAFAAGLRGMMGANLGPNAVLDETGLKGSWNFDVKWSLQMVGPTMAISGDRISVSDALEKQLGLKLEERQVPTPVIVVDSVNRKPSENPPGVAEALPAIPVPTEFEVASIKLADAGARMSRFQMQPGGRLLAEGMPMRQLINRAFNVNNNEQVVLPPKFAGTDRFDITAKAAMGPTAGGIDFEALAPMIRALLVDRFKMTYHTEERPVPAYSLVAEKPKMKKSDPASRTFCKDSAAPAGSPPGSRLLTCQNIAMAQFADRLLNMTQELVWPILDATEIAGGWDFTLMFSQSAMMMAGGRGGDAGQAAAGVPSASDPTGGLTIFEAVQKQLGLKLEKQKRSMPVIVIDHLEEKPTEN